MDQELSNRPDDNTKADEATLSLSTNITSSSSSLATAPSSLQTATMQAKESIISNGSTAPGGSPAERKRETNNNLKIFKNEYSVGNQSNMNQVDDVVEQQVQGENPNGSDLNCNNHAQGSDGNNQVLSNDASSVNSRDNQIQQHDLTHINFDAHPKQTKATGNVNSTISSSPTITTANANSTATADNNVTATPTISTNQPELEPQQVPFKPPANNRSILILREIEPTSSESSVRDIFNSENCPSKPIHCEYALQNSWYVTFRDDEDARLALAYIRKHIVKWKGKPIMARYKPKPAVPSAANQPPPHHHILPPMVMQQQQQIHIEDGESVLGVPDSSIMMCAPVTSVGRINASNVSSGQQSPIVLSSHAILNHTGGGLTPGLSPNDAQSAALNSPSGLMPSYGHTDLYQAPSIPPHHHHPDGSLMHHPHNHHHMGGPHMMGPHTQAMQHPHHQQQMAAGYNLYYGQQSQMIQAPWDLSTVFVYNGLSPFNKTSVSSVSLVGGSYHRNQTQHIDPRGLHSGDVEQVERKQRRRRRPE